MIEDGCRAADFESPDFLEIFAFKDVDEEFTDLAGSRGGGKIIDGLAVRTGVRWMEGEMMECARSAESRVRERVVDGWGQSCLVAVMDNRTGSHSDWGRQGRGAWGRWLSALPLFGRQIALECFLRSAHRCPRIIRPGSSAVTECLD